MYEKTVVIGSDCHGAGNVSIIDSYSRENRYEECEIGIDDSLEASGSLLSGFCCESWGRLFVKAIGKRWNSRL